MSSVTIHINKKPFHIGCESGQENIVLKAATEVISKFEKLKEHSPAASTEYLLVLCCIMLQNEIFEIKNKKGSVSSEDYNELENILDEITSKLEYLLKQVKDS